MWQAWRACALVGAAAAGCVLGVESGGRRLGGTIADRQPGRTRQTSGDAAPGLYDEDRLGATARRRT